MSSRIVITGANGFLGRSILTLLAGQFPQSLFLLLCRSEASAQCVIDYARPLGLDRMRIVRGDIDHLGLGGSDWEHVGQATDVWHVAASTSFDDRDRATIFQTNVGGTRNVLAAARRLPNLRHFYHISTAYVAGTAAGPMVEDELLVPPAFRNAYEESKWEGEKLVRESGLPYTVFRPSIIMGDSQTYDSYGDTRMIYGYLLGLYAALRQEFKRLAVDFDAAWHNGAVLDVKLRTIGHASSTKNFVCIDDVIRAIKAVIALPHVRRTFNLTSQSSLTLGQMRVAIGRALGVSGLSCGGAAIAHPSRAEKSAMRFTHAFDPYTLNSDPVWSSANTNEALGHAGLIDMTSDLFGRLLRSFVEHDIMAKQHAHLPVG